MKHRFTIRMSANVHTVTDHLHNQTINIDSKNASQLAHIVSQVKGLTK